MKKESVEQFQPKSVEVKTWGEFKKALEGWMTSVDGHEYCPECWENYKKKLREDGMEDRYIEDGNVPAAEMARFRKLRDAWSVHCEDEDCMKEVFMYFDRPK